jgi:HNH endonuclease
MDSRLRNTDVAGKQYTKDMVYRIWEKAMVIDDKDPEIWRLDVCGHVIHFYDFGNVNSSYGWEIDHVLPVSLGGDEELANLQPLYWNTNRLKGDAHPWECGEVPDPEGKNIVDDEFH